MKGKRILFWIIGLIITVAAAFYQRVTGPTHPKKVEFELNDKTYEVNLLRSHPGEGDAPVQLKLNNKNVSGKLIYNHKKESGDSTLHITDFIHETVEGKNVMTAYLPHQDPAVKLKYYIQLTEDVNTIELLKEDPIVIRFRGDVPAYVMIPHIIFIFFAMFLANVTGLFAAFKIPQFRRYVTVTLALMLIGGMIFGPIVQKYAFGELWTGFPNGMDLTDNKTLIAFLAWIVAFIMNRKKENRTSAIVASLITIIIFSIPHSMFGSEMDMESGEVVQGFINFMF